MEYKFNNEGLIPAVVQDVDSREVLMLAYMNQEAIEKTIQTKIAHYYSRSRETLWKKGETSGNIQQVVDILYDCDQDTLLLLVKQTGFACHTGSYSCFYRSVLDKQPAKQVDLRQLEKIVKQRKKDMPQGSYTTYLFEKGLDKILKKVAEETGEIIIAAKNNNQEVIYETADLFYHLTVLLQERNIDINEIFLELGRRHE